MCLVCVPFTSFFAKINPLISPLTGLPSQEIGCTVRYTLVNSVCTLIDNESRKDPSNRIKALKDVTPTLADAARALKDGVAEGANKSMGLAVFHDSWTQIRVSIFAATD